MKTYKGFNENMTCQGFQYEEGKEYEEKEAVVCERGFHACEYPLDCFSYYDPNKSVYHEVDRVVNFMEMVSKLLQLKLKLEQRSILLG